MKMNPKSLANLVPHRRTCTVEQAKEMSQKSILARAAAKEVREKFKMSAKAFIQAQKDMPDITGVEVLRMCMHMALGEKNYEDAARYANLVAEYEQPKLQRVEKSVTTKMVDLTDEELSRILSEEGLG